MYLWPQIAPITHFDFEPGPRSSEQSGPPHCIVRLINLQRAQSSFRSSPTPPHPPSSFPPVPWLGFLPHSPLLCGGDGLRHQCRRCDQKTTSLTHIINISCQRQRKTCTLGRTLEYFITYITTHIINSSCQKQWKTRL